MQTPAGRIPMEIAALCGSCTRVRCDMSDVCARIVHDDVAAVAAAAAIPQTGRLMSRDDNVSPWDPFRLPDRPLPRVFLRRECSFRNAWFRFRER